MTVEERKRKIKEFRTQTILGKCIDLKPASEEYAAKIMELRNREKNIYWFNQSDIITLEEQIKWFESYASCQNDIYWVILNKEGQFLGTIRIYDIDFDGMTCEEGSYIIDENYADEAPYAVEAKMLALDVAFKKLEIELVINDNRADNKVISNMDNQLGFDDGSIIKIRGVDYIHRILKAADYFKNRSKFSTLVDYWSMR